VNEQRWNALCKEKRIAQVLFPKKMRPGKTFQAAFMSNIVRQTRQQRATSARADGSFVTSKRLR
jgi:hypothetical protein